MAGGSVKTDENTAQGGAGTIYYYGTGAVSGVKYKYLVANENVTFTSLTDEDSLDLRTELGITTNTVGKGMIIRAINGKYITGFQLATGSVCGVL